MRAFLASSLLASFLLAGTASLAAAQTTLNVSADVVTPGSPITATVTGPPAQFYAIIGSSVGSGMSYGGVALGVAPTSSSSRRGCSTARAACPCR
jgi:type IV secretory pathway VirB2 component (pilin)